MARSSGMPLSSPQRNVSANLKLAVIVQEKLAILPPFLSWRVVAGGHEEQAHFAHSVSVVERLRLRLHCSTGSHRCRAQRAHARRQ